MSTTTVNLNAAVTAAKPTRTHGLSRLWAQAEFNRFGIIAVLILLFAIFGGIAAGFALSIQSMWMLTVVAFASMLALSMILAVAPMRTIIATTALAVLLELIVIAAAAITLWA